MNSWIFKNRARLAVVYGLLTDQSSRAKGVAPGKVIMTQGDALLGPWGKRTG
jgi:hypothetical protein